MMRSIRLMLGISVMWLALSMLSDGLNTLLMPSYLLAWTAEETQATTLGFITFIGLMIGMLVQPIAGTLSDRLYARWGRRSMIAAGVGLVVVALWLLALRLSLPFLFISYLLVQAAANIIQAAQQ